MSCFLEGRDSAWRRPAKDRERGEAEGLAEGDQVAQQAAATAARRRGGRWPLRYLPAPRSARRARAVRTSESRRGEESARAAAPL